MCSESYWASPLTILIGQERYFLRLVERIRRHSTREAAALDPHGKGGPLDDRLHREFPGTAPNDSI